MTVRRARLDNLTVGLTALHGELTVAYDGTSTGTSTAQPSGAAPQAPAGGEDPRVAHGVLPLKAAGVASADLIAHRDTWEWLAALAAGHSHFRTSPAAGVLSQEPLDGRHHLEQMASQSPSLWHVRDTTRNCNSPRRKELTAEFATSPIRANASQFRSTIKLPLVTQAQFVYPHNCYQLNCSTSGQRPLAVATRQVTDRPADGAPPVPATPEPTQPAKPRSNHHPPLPGPGPALPDPHPRAHQHPSASGSELTTLRQRHPSRNNTPGQRHPPVLSRPGQWPHTPSTTTDQQQHPQAR
jgi:hypothetical protein